jgi:hypothetical protein
VIGKKILSGLNMRGMSWLRTAMQGRARAQRELSDADKIRRATRIKRQRGVGALEYIAIATAALFGVIQGMHWWGIYSNSQDDNVNAGQFQQVMQGATQYLNNNTPGASGVIPWATIAPYMPAGLTGTVKNTWGQGYQLAVQVVGSTVNAMIETTGGTAIPEDRMRSIARLIGTSGGYVTTLAPTLATGTSGNWSSTLASFGASPGTGHLAGALFYQTAAAMNGSYLWRIAVPGQPQLNTMATAINMGGNNITNVGQLQTAAGNGVQIGSSYYYGDGANSAIRQDGALFIQNRAGTGAADIAQVGNISSSGSVSAAGNVVAGGTVQGGFLYSTGSLQVNGSAQVNGNVNVNGTVQGGYVNSTGNVNAQGYVTVQGGASPGGGCGGAAIGSGPSGTLLCESGVWSQGGSKFGGAYSYVYPLNGSANTVVQCEWTNSFTGACSCPAGYQGYSAVSGEGFHNSPWDVYFMTTMCFLG